MSCYDLIIENCHIVSPDFELAGAAVAVSGGKIDRIIPAGEELPEAGTLLDARSGMVVPGFIDVHCHGCGGADFSDGSDVAMATIARNKLMEGVTTILPTTLTLPEPRLVDALRSAAEYRASGERWARVPGVHLEGPFINENCLGAQNPDYVRKPDIEEVKRLDAIAPVKKVSFAVEVDGGVEFVRELLAEKIVPSCVHSAAGYADFNKAFAAGLVNLSHFCNQMTGLHHRDIGLVGAGLLHDEVFIETICDKIHLSPEMIKLIFKLKPIDRIMLITDAMSAAGLEDGDYDLGGLAVVVKDGAARLASNGALAGSTLRMNQALKNIHEVTGLPLAQLIKTTSYNQACSLGMDDRGRIACGMLADMVVLDEDFSVRTVIVGGNIKYEA